MSSVVSVLTHDVVTTADWRGSLDYARYSGRGYALQCTKLASTLPVDCDYQVSSVTQCAYPVRQALKVLIVELAGNFVKYLIRLFVSHWYEVRY